MKSGPDISIAAVVNGREIRKVFTEPVTYYTLDTGEAFRQLRDAKRYIERENVPGSRVRPPGPQKRRYHPVRTDEKSTVIHVSLPPQILADLDKWSDGAKRTDAIRHILRVFLTAQKGYKVPF